MNQTDLMELTKKLIQIESTAERPELLKSALNSVEEYFLDIPKLSIKKFEKNGKLSLVVCTQDTLEPDILLCGHLDIVPGKSEQFEPMESKGKLYGRGACDMKSGAAVLTLLMRDLAQNPKPFCIGLMLTTDEESGGKNGVGYLVNEIGYKPKVAIIPDGGNGPDDVVVKNKGVLHLRLSTLGRAAHASRPWEGNNAINGIIEALVKIKELFPAPHADHWTNTLTIGMINGGEAINQVAEKASAHLDIRYVETSSQEKILEEIRSVVPNCEIEVLMQAQISLTEPTHPYLKLYSRVLLESMGKEAKFRGTPGSNDGRYLTAKGIPVVIARPLSGDLHGPDEWVDLAGLWAYAKFLQQYLIELGLLIRSQGIG